ncbi:hypothetical protein VSDG_01974 [Cytospora chrysosperma]|uniref:Uncharacterized protein n=1 Tax=Cytospora chrysosperma TaxID=252740 RepID=A0A423WDQ0_CYTCH|nr:hypothetical protein VSDG_01974 [Valsa sordida]
MVLLDPKVLAEATSAFLAQAQKQADHDPGAISRLEQEAKALREAVTALQGRLDQQEGSAAAVRHEKDLEGLRERVAALEDQASQNVEAAWELHERVSSLEAAREDAARKEARPQNSRFKAFEAYFLAVRKKYHAQKPKDHRAFIWSFIEGISDKEWAQYIQEYLVKALPGKAWRSKSPRNGRVVALDIGLKWEEVREAMSRMQIPSSLA